ncbi:hypothetical protein D9619_010193 [Psilocybe cf. subviscida]|uniref:BTB domain-containing protein n=1 Tax=Psilocybe cf. subviscida TaxID=2480587 RepID=A0A8H5AS38_9AGAR|nr:hypothetical protein D9619_010193 [Psilocybe cf. subviscida]
MLPTFLSWYDHHRKSEAVPNLYQSPTFINSLMATSGTLSLNASNTDINMSAPTRSEIWFEDGNVILQVSNKQYKVHRGVLATHSSVFKDMFGVPQPADQLSVEGCPIAELADSMEDWDEFLPVLYNQRRSTYMRKHAAKSYAMPIKLMIAMLVLGHKYNFRIFWDQALQFLKTCFPPTLGELEAFWFDAANDADNFSSIIINELFRIIASVLLNQATPTPFWFAQTVFEGSILKLKKRSSCPTPFWGPPGGTPYAPAGAIPWTGSSSASSSASSPTASAPAWTFGGGNPWATAAPGWGGPQSAPVIPGPSSAPPYPNGYPSPYAPTNQHAAAGAPWPTAPGTPGGGGGAAAGAGWPWNPQYPPPAPFFTGAAPPGTPYSAAAPYPSPYPSPAGDGGGYGWTPAHQQGGGGGMDYLATPSRRSRKKSRGEHEHAMQYSTSLRRSRSRSRSEFQGVSPSLKRSTSYGGGNPYAGLPAYAKGDVFDENNLARRPTDWRPDYVSPHSGVLDSLRPVVMKHKTVVHDWTDTTRRDIHPLLAYRTSAPPLSFDLRNPIFHPSLLTFHLPSPSPYSHTPQSPYGGSGHRHGHGYATPRPANTVDLLQLALNAPYPFLRLFHPALPWYIDIHASPGNEVNGVTVVDVVRGLSEQLQQAIHGRHYWNETLGRRDREDITEAFGRRARYVVEQSQQFVGWGNDVDEWNHKHGGDYWGAGVGWGKGGAEDEYGAVVSRGVLQVDFLGEKCVFEGLVRGPKGMWEIKTRKPEL